MDTVQQIVSTTEVRRHNGQCAYGDWLDLGDEAVPGYVRDEVADEIVEAMLRDVRREPHVGGNTDEGGRINVGGEIWIYRR